MLTAEQKFKLLLRTHNDYEPEAYNLIYEVLDYTNKNVVKKKRSNHHVIPYELLRGFRLYAIDKFGCLARTVLNELEIRTTQDVGNIVYNLIEYGLMGEQHIDKKKDFHKVYDVKILENHAL